MSLVLLTAAASPAAAQVYARVEADTAIYPGDEVTYSIVVEGTSRPSKVDLSPLAAFHPRSAGSGTSMQTVNDRTTISYSLNYVITAGPPGTMHLPGVTVVVDGQTQTANPVDVTISRPGSTDQITLDFSIAEKQCYVGQPLEMTVRWTATARVRGAAFEVPVFKSEDFYIEDVSEPTSPARDQIAIHGVPITVTEERQLVRGVETLVGSFRKVLIPKRSGRLRLEPVSVSANVAVGREPTGDFFNPYRLKLQRVFLQSKAVELDVQPLPETGKPPQFYGLVGRYTISASAAPTKVSVGDPITLTIRIGDNSFLKPVQWPALEQVPELTAHFKIPAEKASPVLEGSSKVFTQTIRANSDQVAQVPPIPLAYFDPQQGKYVVTRTAPIPLEVSPTKVLTNVDVQGTSSPSLGTKDPSPVQATRQGLSANYYGPEVLEDESFSVLSIVTRPLYAALWAVPLMGLIVSSVVRLAGRTSPEALARRRRRQAAGLALAQLKRVSSVAPEQRHELLLSALKTYIGDRFDKVAASLTAADCGRAILDAGGDADTARKYQERIEACEAARYAPLQAQSGPDQVQAAIELIQSVDRQGRRQKETGKGRSEARRWLSLLSLLFFLFTFSAAPTLPREQLHALLTEANAAFQAANAAAHPDAARPLYDQAILLYEKIIDQGGIHNAKLYYNLANAYLLKEDLGRAILNYRRAVRLDRSDLNIQKNLTFARSRRVDKVETSAEKRVLETLFFWHYDFSLPTKCLLACLSFAVLCGALLLIVWRGRGSASAVTAVVAAVLWVCLVASILVETTRQARIRSGVVTAAEIVARQGDGPNYPPSFQDPLHAGLEFELLERRPGWFHIQLSDGSDAWIPDETAGLV